MRVLNSTIVAAVLFLMIACGGGTGQEESSWTEDQMRTKKVSVDSVMAAHDRSMMRMGEIHQLKVNLIQRVDSSAGDSLLQVIENKVKALEVADEAMMQWMRSYREPRDTVSFEKAIAYLNQEEKKIKEVDEQMKKSISEASELLKSLNHEVE
ncbi:hypothetical protein KFE98_05570 [bacterium SCSIO 12741]|nr:hypothetical protein KFE98_05570 [bacterium SCSIO 12741]